MPGQFFGQWGANWQLVDKQDTNLYAQKFELEHVSLKRPSREQRRQARASGTPLLLFAGDVWLLVFAVTCRLQLLRVFIGFDGAERPAILDVSETT